MLKNHARNRKLDNKESPGIGRLHKLKLLSYSTRKTGSCVLKASVDRVSVDTIGRYGDRHSADISTDTQPICRPRLGRVSVDMNRQAYRPTPGRYFTATRPPLGRHSAATRPILYQHSANTKLTWSALATARVQSSLLY